AWDTTVEAPCTTLDALIAEYGLPAFAKIDVEGFEAAVLAGLTRPLLALSFEFTTIQRQVALGCLGRLAMLGRFGFDVALGESQTLAFNRWVSREDMAAYLLGLPHAANSGDVYCVLQRWRWRWPYTDLSFDSGKCTLGGPKSRGGRSICGISIFIFDGSVLTGLSSQ